METCTHENPLGNHTSKWTNARAKANYITLTVLLNIKTSSYQYMNSHHKHNMVLRLPYLYNGNFRTEKDSIYIEAGLSIRHGRRRNAPTILLCFISLGLYNQFMEDLGDLSSIFVWIASFVLAQSLSVVLVKWIRTKQNLPALHNTKYS